MRWLQSLDVDLFRFINLKLQNPFFDVLMPFVSGNKIFFPVVLLTAVGLLWKGNTRARILVVMLIVLIPIGDGLVYNPIKHAVGRPRPFTAMPDVHLLLGRGSNRSMPSAHAANCFAATMIAFIYFRKTLWFMLPFAALVSFSRVYNGVHYPSDVLVGGILGAGYAVAAVWLLVTAWRQCGPKWFPRTWKKLPSLLP